MSNSPKQFYVQRNTIRSRERWVVRFHDGVSTHRDGSPFFDMRTFRNMLTRDLFVAELTCDGYAQRSSWNAA